MAQFHGSNQTHHNNSLISLCHFRDAITLYAHERRKPFDHYQHFPPTQEPNLLYSYNNNALLRH